jgi:hypothetical protein
MPRAKKRRNRSKIANARNKGKRGEDAVWAWLTTWFEDVKRTPRKGDFTIKW